MKNYLLRFYWRRGLRIWPVYFGFLGVCVVVYQFTGIPETMTTAWVWLTTFTYNLVRYLPGFQDSNYFGHFWTLCIEEQFYLVWPFVVFFLSRAWLRRVVVTLVVVGPLIRLVSGVWLGAHFGDANLIAKGVHNWPTSHLDAFAIGALLTLLPDQLREWMSPRATNILIVSLALVVTAGIAQAWVCHANNKPPAWLAFGYGGLADYYQYAWAYTLLNVASAALVWCVLQENRLRTWLSWSWLAYIGKISFGLYVFHLPLMHVSHAIWPAGYHSAQGLIRFSIYFTVTLGLAAFSYQYFEKRFLALKDSGWGALHRSV